MENNPDCELCNLCNVAQNVCIPGSGRRSAKVMVVGDSPSFVDDRSGVVFSDKVGEMLESLFNEFDVDPTRFFYTTVVKCRTPDKTPASVKQQKACKPYFETELEEVKPKFVLLLGAIALKSVLGNVGKVTEIHGSLIEKDGITYMPILGPGMAIRDPKMLGPIRNDIRKFVGVITGKSIEVKAKLNYEIVNDVDGLRRCIAAIQKAKRTSFDSETTGLDRFADDAMVTTLIIGTFNKQWIFFFSKVPTNFTTHSIQQQILILLSQALKGREVSGANFKFDNLYLEYLYDIKIPFTFDTGLAAHLLNENELQKLKYQVRNVFNAEDWDISLAAKTGNEGPEVLGKYGAGDGYWTRKLATHQDKQLIAEDALSELYRKLVIPVAHIYEKIEKNGVFIDIPNMRKARRVLKQQRSIARKTLDRIGKGLGHTDVNWNSHDQVRDVLFNTIELPVQELTKTGAASTGADSLGMLKGQHEIIEPLLKYREAQKLITGFVDAWGKHMHDGCWLHPSFKIGGTVTGRPSCNNPNLQQTPRNKLIRNLIGAPEGWLHFQLDYSQLELRIAAILSGCEEMLAVFLSGGDIHRATASAVSGTPLEMITDDERFKAKAVNFGFIYGMGWKNFIKYAFNEYGVILSERESKAFRKRYFERYPGLQPWHDRMRRIVHSQGYVRTMTGRIRHLGDIYSPDSGVVAQAERNAINSPVQGFGGEFTLMGLLDIDKEYDIASDYLQISGTIHDAILGRVRIEHAGEILPKMQKLMEHPSLVDEFGIELPIDMVVDLDIGNWGNKGTLGDFLLAA